MSRKPMKNADKKGEVKWSTIREMNGEFRLNHIIHDSRYDELSELFAYLFTLHVSEMEKQNQMILRQNILQLLIIIIRKS